MFEPKNELGVLYWFARLHEKLGFEKILHIGAAFPDIKALRNGKIVRIELEYKLSGFLNHYYPSKPGFIDWIYFRSGRLKWVWRDGAWRLWSRDEGLLEYPQYEDPDGKRYLLDENGLLRYRSLRDQVDVIICWIVNCELPEPFEVICLKDEVEKLPSISGPGAPGSVSGPGPEPDGGENDEPWEKP